MRDYGKVSPQFWVGKTGKALRGDMPAQLLSLYLMTSPHANMIGIYYCPIEYMAKETGLSMEGASKALQRLIDADFCTYEADDELIFVHAFAEHQIGESLKPTDLRVKGIISELEKVPKGQCWRGFRARYAVPYNLPTAGQIPDIPASPYKAPSKPETETETETGAGAEPKPTTAKRSTPPSKRKISLPDGFGVSAAVTAWAAEKGFGQLDAHLDAFTRKAKAKGYTYVDWDAAFMEAIWEDWAKLRGRAANGAAPPPDSTTKTGTDAAEATRREREARDKGAAPPPAHIRAQLASLTKKFTGAMA